MGSACLGVAVRLGLSLFRRVLQGLRNANRDRVGEGGGFAANGFLSHPQLVGVLQGSACCVVQAPAGRSDAPGLSGLCESFYRVLTKDDGLDAFALFDVAGLIHRGAFLQGFHFSDDFRL